MTVYNFKLIRSIKYSLVIAVLLTGLVLCYFIFANQNDKLNQKDKEVSKTTDHQVSPSFQANTPNLIGLSLEHGPYYMQAKEMEELSGKVYFILPKVRMMLKHIDWLNLTSKRANLTKNDNHLQLFDTVRANLNKEYYFEGEQAEILSKESIIRSDQYSKIFTDMSNIDSQTGFILNYEDQTAFFHGSINANMKRADDNSITNIKSDKFDLFWQKNTGDFLGNVILTKEGTIVKSAKMTVIMNPKTNQLDRVYAYGKVKIIDKEQTSTSEYGEYIVSTGILTLKDQVKLFKDNNVMNGELLHYNFNTKKSDLIGSSKKKKTKRARAVIIPKNKNEQN
jgi:lipopolysaccharide transport protein LptA